MRQSRPFPSVSQQPEPVPPARQTRWQAVQQRLKRFYTRFHSVFLVAAGVVVAVGIMFAYDAAKPPPQRLTQRDIDRAVVRALDAAPAKPSIASEVYQIIRPSLVRIETLVPKAGEKDKDDGAVGTGFIIDDKGRILTNHHVIRGATRIQVTFADGSETDAAVLAQEPENDLALLQPSVIPDDIVPATMGGGVRVGDEVVAVGHPYGITNSVTAGVVSGLGRSFKSPKAGQTLTGLIQFDAAVNPGNSGGPLLNRDGEVVGVVTGLLNPTDQDVFIGIGFAVTMESAGGIAGAPPV